MIPPPALFTLAQQIRELQDFGGLQWKDQTTLHPLGLVLTLICGCLVLSVRRAYAVWPFIFMACFVSSAQRLVVASLDFNLIRLMVLFGVARVIIHGETRGFRWQRLDTLVMLFALSRTVIYTLQQMNLGALIYQTGASFDAVGIYFLMRCIVRSMEDIIRVAIGFAVIAIPTSVAFLSEHFTRHNIFAIFGGVHEITVMREGRLRCQGAFSHPIIAGCFWASTLPLTAALFWQGARHRALSVTGSICALTVVGLCASSTPVMGVLAAIMGGILFFVRWWMRGVVVGFCALLVLLHFSMKAPVWHLVSRLTIARGNTGYHRFQLIDSTIHRVDEWWLLGTRSTAHWFWGGQDITNQFVLEAVRGGLTTLVLFCCIVGTAFMLAARCWRAARGRRDLVILSWALWTTFLVHSINFVGVSYFGQITMLWYLHLAMIGSMGAIMVGSAVGDASGARASTAARRLQARLTSGAEDER